MPAFLDFLFPYGRQQYAQDFHSSGFRYENTVSEVDRGLQVPELGRSGREIRLCYSLKSVEPSNGQLHWPWSVRQIAVYHSFDVENGRATWIIVKGNQLMKNRLISATESGGSYRLNLLETDDRALASALATQSLICDWSGENWRWYINFLEEALQTATRHTLSIPIESPSRPVLEKSPSIKAKGKAPKPDEKAVILDSEKAPLPGHAPSMSPTPAPAAPPTCIPDPLPRPQMPPGPTYHATSNMSAEFSFRDLQRIQFIEEKVNEALLVLEINSTILSEMKNCYGTLSEYRRNCSGYARILLNCGEDIKRFEKHITNLENDAQLQQSRAKTLLHLLADRKNLVCPSATNCRCFTGES